jgi:hypothetical protein
MCGPARSVRPTWRASVGAVVRVLCGDKGHLDGAAQVWAEATAARDGDAGARDLPGGPLYVHLDLDVTDPAEVPGLRYPTSGGPGLAQVASALHMVLGTGLGRCRGHRLHLASWAPRSGTHRPLPGSSAHHPHMTTVSGRRL